MHLFDQFGRRAETGVFDHIYPGFSPNVVAEVDCMLSNIGLVAAGVDEGPTCWLGDLLPHSRDR